MSFDIDCFDWRASFAPEHGGNLYRLAWRGRELLRAPDDLEQLRADPEKYGIPVLFPPGRIDGGIFIFEGRCCRLPLNEPERGNHLHGLALRAAWRVIRQTGEQVTLGWTYDENAPEFAGFPFPFALELDYRFEPDRVIQELRVTNCGSTAMPCAAGFHTVFRDPLRVRVAATAEYWEIPWPRCLATGRKLPWAKFDPRRWFAPSELESSRQFPAPAGTHAAELEFAGVSLRYEADEKFRQWYLWNRDPESGFLAVEPMSCVSGAFNLNLPETGLFSLAPGAKELFHSELIIVKGD